MPLVCLLNLNGYGEQHELKDVERSGWHNYNIFPMGANVQFVFYRNPKKGGDILMKVLLNEDETTLHSPTRATAV